MSNYWYQPAQFNPSLAFQRQALLDMLMRMQARTMAIPSPQPTWRTPEQVSPSLLMQGLRPTRIPTLPIPRITFEPPPPLGGVGPLPPTPGMRMLGPPAQSSTQVGPTQVGPTIPSLPGLRL